MAREMGSWLSGPQSLGSGDDGFPGQRLGLPAQGPGSLARMGRRAAALMVDWLMSYGLAALGLAAGLYGSAFLATGILLIWFVLGVLSVRLFGFTPGQYVLGLRTASVDNRLHVGTGRAVVRGLLIALVIPALFTDTDGRGIQDRITATAVVRR
ncbi:MAG: RDD family protein [Mycobacterium sp.]